VNRNFSSGSGTFLLEELVPAEKPPTMADTFRGWLSFQPGLLSDESWTSVDSRLIPILSVKF